MSAVAVAPLIAAERVVITGLGALCGLGVGLPAIWPKLLEGRSGIHLLSSPDYAGLAVRLGAQVPDFDPEQWMERRDAKRVDLSVAYGVAAATMAWRDAGLDVEACLPRWDPERAGVAWGTAIGGIDGLERGAIDRHENKRLSAFFIAGILPNMTAGHVSIALNLQGPSLCQATACAASAHALGIARMLIASGAADVMVVGGSEKVATPLTIAAHHSMRALSARHDDPASASRPWDRDRDGFVLGDGGGALVLESESHARRRRAPIYAELAGFGMSSDANHMTAPREDGAGAARAMRIALRDAGLAPDQIEYINAHGTSTPVGDRAEVAAIKSMFGAHAHRLAVSSTKSMTGHLLGAAGALEAVFTVKALHTGTLPPTANLTNPEDGCDLDFVPGAGRQQRVRRVLSNSFGFGGTNAALVFQEMRA